MSMGLAARMALVSAVAGAAVVGVSAAPVWGAIERNAADDLSEALLVQAQLVASGAGETVTDLAAAEALARRSAQSLDSTVVIVDRVGGVQAQAAASGLRFDSYANRPEVAGALRGQSSTGVRFSASLGEEILYAAIPVVRDGQLVGAVRLTREGDDVRARALADARPYGLAAVAVVTAAALLGAAGARSFSHTITDITAAAHAGGQEPTLRVPLGGDRSRRRAALAVNALLDRLDRTTARHREFLADTAHHLRTPLTAIRLRVEAATDATDDPQTTRQLAAADREALRLAGLLDGLLNLARQAAPADPAARCNLTDELRAAQDRWQPAASSQNRVLDIEYGDDPDPSSGNSPLWLRIAPTDLTTVVDNLLSNALNHGAGTVSLRVTRPSPERVRLRVTDEGAGLPEADLPRSVQRFWRGDRATTPGSGLGLGLVAAVAERYDGMLTVANRAATEGQTGLQVDLLLPPD